MIVTRKNLLRKKYTEDILTFLIDDIGICVNKTVDVIQTSNYRRKKVGMLSIEDIKTLSNYLKNKRADALSNPVTLILPV